MKTKIESVTRYVVTHIGREGVRTLASACQGRYTYATHEEAQGHLDAMMKNNSRDTLESVYGLPLEVRPVECYPGHHDPKRIYFDADPDFSVQNEGTIFLLRPLTDAAKEWVSEHLTASQEVQWFGGAVVVEHRYIADIVAGITNDGLNVEGA